MNVYSFKVFTYTLALNDIFTKLIFCKPALEFLKIKMNKSTLILFALFISLIGFSQQKIGSWAGKIKVAEQALELRLHLFQQTDKSYISNWDVPAQRAKGINSSSTTFVDTILNIEIKAIGAKYSGVYQPSANAFKGFWTQSGQKFPLNLEIFTDTVEKIVIKPQTPKRPFLYQTKDFVYEGVNTKLKYGATLTYPSNKEKSPLIILITGSGKQDRDETLFNHKPFAVLADYFTKKGYAVLRVDDRGMGKSTGDFNQSTSEDFAQDVEEHINFAKGLKEIDTTKIGLCGHSEGGLIAPLVASRNKSVSFIILMAGPGIDITEMMVLQNEGVLRSNGVSKDATAAYLPLYKAFMEIAIKNTDNAIALAKAKELVNNWFESTNKEWVKATTGINSKAEADKFASILLYQLSSKWWKFFASYNPQPTLEKLKCPVLAINGGTDIQVIADANLKGIESSLKKGKNKHFTIKKFDGLNHLFQKCKTCTVSEYPDLETTIELEVLDYMYNWLIANKII